MNKPIKRYDRVARITCKGSGNNALDHIVDITEMVETNNQKTGI